MKTKNIVLALIIMLSGGAIFAQKAEVNTKKTTIEWLGKKIGRQHNGNIQLKSGYLDLKAGEILGGKFIVDMTSISDKDLKNETYNKKLVDHLKSDDFFSVETYPTAEFVVSESTKFDNGTATIKGALTIKGKTENISFEVEREGNEYTARLDIDRSKFDVKFGSKSFFKDIGDKAIDDIFVLNIELVLI